MNTLRAASFALCALAAAGNAPAQVYPAKPIRLVVPYPPGGSNDVLSRITAQAMSPGLGQPVIVENRSGAGGMIGADLVAKSAPDGYSLVNVQASFTANAALRPKMAYDPMSDFAYIGMMTREQFTRSVANEITRWRKVAQEANIQPE